MERQVLIHNPNNPVTVTVERLVGPFEDPSLADLARGAGSVVVKTLTPHGDVVVPHWTAGHDADHWNLWNREALAYTTDLVNVFSATDLLECQSGSLSGSGFRGPQLLGQILSDDGSVSLYLEDVRGRTGAALTMGDHSRMAARLGEAQGRLSLGDSATGGWGSMPWLSRSWVRQYGTSRISGPEVYDDSNAWNHPVVFDGFGSDRHEIRRRFGELYRSSGEWFDLLEALPQTLCHLDYWPNNAIAGDDGTDVLVDWSFVGVGAVGEDPGNWIPDSVFDHFVEPGDLEDLESTVWSAYSSGLERSGWGGPLEIARLGMLASAVKYIWLPGLMVGRADHVGPTAYGDQDGFVLAEVFARRLPVLFRLLEWIEEAQQLRLDLDGQLD